MQQQAPKSARRSPGLPLDFVVYRRTNSFTIACNWGSLSTDNLEENLWLPRQRGWMRPN